MRNTHACTRIYTGEQHKSEKHLPNICIYVCIYRYIQNVGKHRLALWHKLASAIAPTSTVAFASLCGSIIGRASAGMCGSANEHSRVNWRIRESQRLLLRSPASMGAPTSALALVRVYESVASALARVGVFMISSARSPVAGVSGSAASALVLVGVYERAASVLSLADVQESTSEYSCVS